MVFGKGFNRGITSTPISDYTGKLELHFVGEEYRLKRPRHDVEEAKEEMPHSPLKCM